MTDTSKIVYWPRLLLARRQIEARLGAVPGASLVVAESLEQFLDEIPGAAGVVLPDAPVDQARQISQALTAPAGASVRWMHIVTAGRNGFDAVGLPSRIAVTIARGATAPSVAEHAMALLLGLVRRLPDMLDAAAEARWTGPTLMTRSDTIEGKRMLIVGLGPIGIEIMKRAAAFGMQVEAVTRTARQEPGFEAVRAMDELDARLPHADVLMLSAPLTPQTHKLIDARRLALMAPDAYLINIGRGGLVDQDALVAALNEHRLAGAGLDVTTPEPLPPDNPLWRCQRLILSPHIAGGIGLPSMERVGESAAENCRRLLAGEPLVNRIEIAAAGNG